jgi:HlyD family secretion protein
MPVASQTSVRAISAVANVHFNNTMKSAAILAALLTLAACSGSQQTDRLRVRRGTFDSRITLTGELEAKRGRIIAVPRMPNWQSSIKWIAEDGTFVHAGDRVVELDAGGLPTDLEAKRQQETQAVQQLQQRDSEWAAQLGQKQLEVEKKVAELEKVRLLTQVPRDLLAPREYEQRQLNFHRAESELAKARELFQSDRKGIDAERANLRLQIDKTQREIARSSTALQSLFLRAPADGIVVVRDQPWEGRKLRPGDMVWVGLPLAFMPDLSSLQVNAALADVDDGRVAPGMKATVTLDGYPRERFTGRVASVTEVAQESARNSVRRFFRVYVLLDRVDGDRMRPGLSARVQVVRQSRKGVLLAARETLRFAEGKAHAALSGGKDATVKIEECNATDCIVASGLEEGQRLRVRGEGPDA